MRLSRICQSAFTSGLRRTNKIIGCLCLLTVCTMYWSYYTVSDGLGKLHNRRSYITNSRRWNELMNGSHEHVWPRTFNETYDRIESQLRFMDYYGSQPANRSMKYILRVGVFNFEGVRDGSSSFVNGRCPVHECSIISDEAQSHSVDVLLISEMSYFNWLKYLPKPSHQLWIAQHWESAMNNRINTWLVSNRINWTVSYRRDSTLGISYGKYARTMNASSSQKEVDYSTGKTKQVAWLVSNCQAHNDRLEYAHELAKYIDVDIYGHCGSLSCSRTGPESCLSLLVKKYRFFLAFENSNCKDYITEKLYYKALKHNVIPVVMGARSEDYAALAPTGSYIDVRDFGGPRDLAQYLKAVAENHTLYNEYFEWRKTWSVIDDRYWCRLCMMLHLRDDIGYVTWFENYHTWWNSVCDSCNLHSSSIAIRNALLTFFSVSILVYNVSTV